MGGPAQPVEFNLWMWTHPPVSDLVLVENYVESIKFGVLLYLLTFVGAIFNTLTLVILGWIGAFLFPTIYDQNQDMFDDLAAQLVEKYQGVNQKLTAMLPAPKKVATNGTNGAVAAGQEKEE